MNGFNIETTNSQLIISVEKKCFNEKFLLQMLERIRIEYLAKKANFNDKILDIATEIDNEWWKKNKKTIIKMGTK